VISNTISNETFYSVTGLLPGTTYELTVVAVSQGGDVVAESQPSGPIVNTTGVTGWSITTCNLASSGVTRGVHVGSSTHNPQCTRPIL
jgi:hypothetical protein